MYLQKVFELENERERLMWELKKPIKTDHCDKMEVKEPTNPGQEEVSCVEMSLSNDQTSKELTDSAIDTPNKSDGELESCDENLDTFG